MEPISEFDHPEHRWKWTALELRWISKRIEAEIAAEREVCAKVCESRGPTLANSELLAELIRMRSNDSGNKPPLRAND